jgi:hypothetical protein
MRSAHHLAQFKWSAGQSGNPAGRPKGSRARLEEKFLTDLLESWNEHGKESIAQAREKDVVSYVKIVASLMPKQVEPDQDIDGLSRDELRAAIDALRRFIAPAAVGGDGGDARSAEPARELPPLPEAD